MGLWRAQARKRWPTLRQRRAAAQHHEEVARDYEDSAGGEEVDDLPWGPWTCAGCQHKNDPESTVCENCDTEMGCG